MNYYRLFRIRFLVHSEVLPIFSEMKQLLYLFFSIVFPYAAGAQESRIDSLFMQAPREVLPVLDRTSRLDIIDLYNNGLSAKAENIFGGQTEISGKNDRCIRLKTSDVGTWEMGLLPTETDTVIICITSIKADGVMSDVQFYRTDWTPAPVSLPHPKAENFIRPGASFNPVQKQYLYAALEEAPLHVTYVDSLPAVRLELSIDGFPLEERGLAADSTVPLTYIWYAGGFFLKQE